jgi:hypothetical protein
MTDPMRRPTPVTTAAFAASLMYATAWALAVQQVAEEAALSADEEMRLRHERSRAARAELQRQIDEARERDERGDG